MDEDIVNNEDYEDVAVIVHGVLAPEGIRTRDGRRFKDGAIWWNRLPLPLLYQDKTADGHDASVRTGKIEEIIRKDGLLYWQGSLLDTDFTDRVVQEIAEEVADGISVDLFDVITQIEDADGNVVDEGYERSFVEDVWRRVKANHFKRTMPNIAKVSRRTIGHDFLYLRDWTA